jgi:hypothetical protein
MFINAPDALFSEKKNRDYFSFNEILIEKLGQGRFRSID